MRPRFEPRPTPIFCHPTRFFGRSSSFGHSFVNVESETACLQTQMEERYETNRQMMTTMSFFLQIF